MKYYLYICIMENIIDELEDIVKTIKYSNSTKLLTNNLQYRILTKMNVFHGNLMIPISATIKNDIRYGKYK